MKGVFYSKKALAQAKGNGEKWLMFTQYDEVTSINTALQKGSE